MEKRAYSNDRLALVPYSEETFPEDFLARMYLQGKKDGGMGRLFAGWQGLTLNDFIYHVKNKPIVVGLDKTYNTPAGFAWLWGIEGQKVKKASVAFLFFKQYWGQPLIHELSRLALRWWFEELDISVLFGPMLRSNRLAIRFSRQLGFQKVAEVPMFYVGAERLEDATLMMLSREEWTRDNALLRQRDASRAL